MDAAAELYDRYAAQIYAVALRIVRDEGDAEDVVQDVFSQAWRSAGQHDRTRGSVAAWLLTITRTRAIDRIRAKRSRPDTNSGVLPDSIQASEPPVFDRLVAAQEASRVRDAMGSLSDSQRTALELAYFEGLTQVEIAARLSEPLGTIKTRMRTALSALRTRLRT